LSPSGDRPHTGEGSPRETRRPQAQAIAAGRVGRAHGLDGSFYVTGARERLLVAGAVVTLDGRERAIVRRAGTGERPIVRLQGIDDRSAAHGLRGKEITVPRGSAPELGREEWWAEDLEGCEITDGDRVVGVVRALVELPSCEALEIDRVDARGAELDPIPPSAGSVSLLVPMVRDAIRSIDIGSKKIDVDMSFLEGD
jgi:16S rRNA processing protein RimM